MKLWEIESNQMQYLVTAEERAAPPDINHLPKDHQTPHESLFGYQRVLGCLGLIGFFILPNGFL